MLSDEGLQGLQRLRDEVVFMQQGAEPTSEH